MAGPLNWGIALSVHRCSLLGWSNSLEKILPNSYIEGEALTASILVSGGKSGGGAGEVSASGSHKWSLASSSLELSFPLSLNKKPLVFCSGEEEHVPDCSEWDLMAASFFF